MTFATIRQSWYSRLISFCLMVTFITTMVITPKAQAGVMGLPQPGTMVNLSPAYVPLMVTGLTIHPENPLLMDFIVSTGNSGLNADQVKKESDRLIKYFLACLTIPENDQWVNLSPYEKQRIVPEDLGQTVLGQDMLAQDYLLKQLTASLIYPEKNLGKNFWDKVYARANQMYGTTQVPVNTFNKVWILPEYAKVYEHKDTVIVVKSHLKVMLDEDYLALNKHMTSTVIPAKAGIQNKINTLGSQIVRQIILPAIEKEVNTGKNFAQLRQIYNSMILAVWFKNNLKQALLNQVYTDKSMTNGVNVDDPAIKEKIYQQYLQAYKKGVFNYIKEETDQATQQTIPRKYFSGGLAAPSLAMIHTETGAQVEEDLSQEPAGDKYFRIEGGIRSAPASNAMTVKRIKDRIGGFIGALNQPLPFNRRFDFKLELASKGNWILTLFSNRSSVESDEDIAKHINGIRGGLLADLEQNAKNFKFSVGSSHVFTTVGGKRAEATIMISNAAMTSISANAKNVPVKLQKGDHILLTGLSQNYSIHIKGKSINVFDANNVLVAGINKISDIKGSVIFAYSKTENTLYVNNDGNSDLLAENITSSEAAAEESAEIWRTMARNMSLEEYLASSHDDQVAIAPYLSEAQKNDWIPRTREIVRNSWKNIDALNALNAGLKLLLNGQTKGASAAMVTPLPLDRELLAMRERSFRSAIAGQARETLRDLYRRFNNPIITRGDNTSILRKLALIREALDLNRSQAMTTPIPANAVAVPVAVNSGGSIFLEGLSQEYEILVKGNGKVVIFDADGDFVRGSFIQYDGGIVKISNWSGNSRSLSISNLGKKAKVLRAVNDASRAMMAQTIRVMAFDPTIAEKTIGAIDERLQGIKAKYPPGTKFEIIRYPADLPKTQEALEEFIEQEKASVYLLRSDTTAFGKSAKNPDGFDHKAVIRTAYKNGGRVFVRMGVATDNIDDKYAAEVGISVLSTKGSKNSVADLTLFLVSFLKSMNFQKENGYSDVPKPGAWDQFSVTGPTVYAGLLPKGKWGKSDKNQIMGEMVDRILKREQDPLMALAQVLQGEVIGLVGFGDIGQEVARKLQKIKEKTGVEFRVLAATRAFDKGDADRLKLAEDLGVEVRSRQDLVKEATIISMHIPDNSDIEKFTAEELSHPQLKVIINTSRENVIEPGVVETFVKKGGFFLGDLDVSPELFSLMTDQDTRDRVFNSVHIGASTPDAQKGVEANTLPVVEEVVGRLMGAEPQMDLNIVNDLEIRLLGSVRDLVSEENQNVPVKVKGTAGWRTFLYKDGNPENGEGPFNMQNVGRTVAALATKMNDWVQDGTYTPVRADKKLRVLVAYDGRPNGKEFASHAARVAYAYGMDVDISNDYVATPEGIFATRRSLGEKAYDVVVVVTASHNDYRYDGLKVGMNGSIMPDTLTGQIDKLANDESFRKSYWIYADPIQFKEIDLKEEADQRYQKAFSRLPDTVSSYLSVTGKKLFVDFMHGSDGRYADYYQKMGAEVRKTDPMRDDTFPKKMFNENGKLVPYRPQPIREILDEELTEFESDNQIPEGSIYSAIDGDGDRFAAWIKRADKAREVSPNEVMLLTLWHLKQSNRLPPGLKYIVVTAPSSYVVRKYAESIGLQVIETPVGSKYIGPHMNGEDPRQAVLVWEESGHGGFRMVLPSGEVITYFDDANAQSLYFLDVVSSLPPGQDVLSVLDQLRSQMNYTLNYDKIAIEATDEAKNKIRLPLKDTNSTRELAARISRLVGKDMPNDENIYLTTSDEKLTTLFLYSKGGMELNLNEGLKLRFEDGSWVHIRMSGTEPVIRIYGEFDNENPRGILNHLAKEIFGDQAMGTFRDEELAPSIDLAMTTLGSKRSETFKPLSVGERKEVVIAEHSYVIELGSNARDLSVYLPSQGKRFDSSHEDGVVRVDLPGEEFEVGEVFEEVGKDRIRTKRMKITNNSKVMLATTADKAALARVPIINSTSPLRGGIDLNSRNLNLESSGEKVNITFDPAMIAQFKRGDFSGVRIQILDLVPINLMPLLGLKEDEEMGLLAKA